MAALCLGAAFLATILSHGTTPSALGIHALGLASLCGLLLLVRGLGASSSERAPSTLGRLAIVMMVIGAAAAALALSEWLARQDESLLRLLSK